MEQQSKVTKAATTHNYNFTVLQIKKLFLPILFLSLILTCLLGSEESPHQKKLRIAMERVDSCMKSATTEINEEVRKLVASACKTLQIDLNKMKRNIEN